MELPIPSHLNGYFVPTGNENNEYGVTGTIRCLCGCDKFEVWESNNRHIIKLVCKQCGHEIMLFDEGKHGWNGFVCGDDFLDREALLQNCSCSDCNKALFRVSVNITSQGKQDFLEECVENDDSFSEEDWVDGFEGIKVSLICEDCGLEEAEWSEIETM